MRRKGRKVIKPAGSELMDYLNKGYAICNKCGAVMDRKEDPEGGCDIYACPSCGWEIEELDYEYESADEMELGLDERGDEYLIFRDEMPPAGCKACGGPYPYCKASCKMFDDYGELIALNTHMIQKLYQMVEELLQQKEG